MLGRDAQMDQPRAARSRDTARTMAQENVEIVRQVFDIHLYLPLGHIK
jgi:hypothetical protein